MTTARDKRRKTASEELASEFGHLTFADILLSYRVGEGLTQSELAETIGISTQRLCDFEKGRRLPGLRSAYEFAKRLGLHPETWVLVVIQDTLRRERINMKIELAG